MSIYRRIGRISWKEKTNAEFLERPGMKRKLVTKIKYRQVKIVEMAPDWLTSTYKRSQGSVLAGTCSPASLVAMGSISYLRRIKVITLEPKLGIQNQHPNLALNALRADKHVQNSLPTMMGLSHSSYHPITQAMSCKGVVLEAPVIRVCHCTVSSAMQIYL